VSAQGYTGAQVAIADVEDLQVQLDGKQAVGDYLTSDDIDNLVSSESLNEGLGLKLDKANPVVTDSTFTVVRSAGGAARWRATGSALDAEFVGDVIESRRANQDFTGAQVNLRRMRGDGNTLVGRTEFGTGPYAADGFIDYTTATGAAKLPATAFTGAISGPVISAADHGLAGWTFPADNIQAGTILPTAGLSYVVRIRAMSALITNLHIHLTVAGSVLANSFMTLHSDAGVLLGAGAVTGDRSTDWQVGGFKTNPLVTPQAVTPGGWYKVRWWVGSATTLPTLSRGINSSAAITNVNLAAPNFRYATADASLTTVALAPTTIGTLTGGATGWWVGLS
jgi:hypothetical protein